MNHLISCPSPAACSAHSENFWGHREESELRSHRARDAGVQSSSRRGRKLCAHGAAAPVVVHVGALGLPHSRALCPIPLLVVSWDQAASIHPG